MTIRPLWISVVGGGSNSLRSYRSIVFSGELNSPLITPTSVRVCFTGYVTGSYTITGASIGNRSSGSSYVSGEYVRLTFGGANGATISTNEYQWSDWVEWSSLDFGANWLIHIDMSGEYYCTLEGGSVSPVHCYYKSGALSDCMSETLSGYTSSTLYTWGFTQIQVKDNDGIEEIVRTFDSGGAGSLPGGNDPDFTSIGTWEAATDLALDYKDNLEIYDSQNHSITGQTLIAGSSGLSRSIYRILKGSPSCSVPFTGRAGTGPTFFYTGGGALNASEGYVRFQDLCLKGGLGTAKNTSTGLVVLNTDYAKVIRCVAYDTSGETTNAFHLEQTRYGFCYACLVYGCDYNAFYLYPGGSTDDTPAICCTACDNTPYYGFYVGYFSQYGILWSNYAAGNGADFSDNARPTYSGWNASSDETADIAGDAGDNYKNSLDLLDSLDADYLPTTASGFSANGSAGDRYGRNPYDDLFASFDYDDFFKNDTSGEADSFLDIQGNTRPNSTTADSTWAVGASEYEAPTPGGSGEAIMPFVTLF